MDEMVAGTQSMADRAYPIVSRSGYTWRSKTWEVVCSVLALTRPAGLKHHCPANAARSRADPPSRCPAVETLMLFEKALERLSACQQELLPIFFTPFASPVLVAWDLAGVA